MGSGPIDAVLPLADFAARAIADGVALVTYISEVRSDDLQFANRSSLWVFDDDRWQLTFHQGTPLAGDRTSDRRRQTG
jgi:hypothetical protein